MTRTLILLVALVSLAAGPAWADDAGSSNKAHVERFYTDVVNGGNLDLLDEMMTEDFVDHEMFPGLASGREGVKQFFTLMRTAFPDLAFKVEFMLADGDKVASYITITGTHKGEFMGMAPTGKPMNVHAIDIIRLVDGKAVEHWGVTDAMAMMEQLGALPSHE